METMSQPNNSYNESGARVAANIINMQAEYIKYVIHRGQKDIRDLIVNKRQAEIS